MYNEYPTYSTDTYIYIYIIILRTACMSYMLQSDVQSHLLTSDRACMPSCKT